MTTPAACQNCGAALAGPYCSACGQKGDVEIPSLGRLLAEAVGDLYNFDSRVWRTLGTLVLKPGRLTRVYLEGRRARFTPPFRTYLVASLTFFLVFALVRLLTPADEGTDAATAGAPALPAVPAAEQNLPEPAAQGGQGTLSITIDDDDLECNLAPGVVADPVVRERLEAACERVEEAGADSFNRELADNFPVTMLVFIPIVAGIMKLLYLFARRKYVEHLVFFLHVHTFFFVVALATVLLSGASAVVPALELPVAILGGALWLYFLVYLYLAMREVYGQSHGWTTVKYVALGASYFVAAVVTILAAVIVTAVTI